MHVHIKVARFLETAVFCALMAATGCADTSQNACEGVGGLTAVCRSCEGDLPQGPNASPEACAAFGEENGCDCASHTGSCSNPDLADKAVCEVRGCTIQPTCPTPP